MAAGDAYRITDTVTICGIDTDFMHKNTEGCHRAVPPLPQKCKHTIRIFLRQ